MDTTKFGSTRTEVHPLELLQRLVGAGNARKARPGDAVAGVMPGYVVAPGSVEETGEVMKLAQLHGMRVAPRGSGTKMGWGGPPRALDLIVSTERLNRVIEHAAGDLVVKAEAGTKLREVQDQLASAGQMLALDPPEREATLGGIIVTNASGASRLRYGTVRDLLIGITVVLADGTIAHAGGKVVKNVAGYDLGKLFTGSFGTLGLVAEATFRLHPLPRATRTVLIDLSDPDVMGAAVLAVMGSDLVPSALELVWPVAADVGSLAVLFGGVELGVRAQSDSAMDLLARYGCPRVLDGEEEWDLWEGIGRLPWSPGEVGLKISSVPTELPRILRGVRDLSASSPIGASVVAHAGSGIILVGLNDGNAPLLSTTVERLRGIATGGGGSLVVLEAPVEVKAAVDVWGPPPAGGALPLMRRVKARFDPAGTLNPGRFIGGI